MAVEPDPAQIGKVFEVTEPVAVTEEQIREFCRALGEEPSPAAGSHDGRLAAPASFAVTFRNGRHFFEYTPAWGHGFDAGKDMEFLAPIRAGDRISLSSHVKEIYEKTGRSGRMVFVVIRSTLKNQDDQVVAHVDHRFVHRR